MKFLSSESNYSVMIGLNRLTRVKVERNDIALCLNIGSGLKIKAVFEKIIMCIIFIGCIIVK